MKYTVENKYRKSALNSYLLFNLLIYNKNALQFTKSKLQNVSNKIIKGKNKQHI